MQPVPLSTGLGEVMAPQTLVTALVLSPDGTIQLDPGVLHGRSSIEQSLQWVSAQDQLINPTAYWIVWVAVELDPSNHPIRYKGLAVSELWVDHVSKTGYKVLAEHVNRMAEAMRGGVNLKTLGAKGKSAIVQHLVSLSPEVWERSPEALKRGLA